MVELHYRIISVSVFRAFLIIPCYFLPRGQNNASPCDLNFNWRAVNIQKYSAGNNTQLSYPRLMHRNEKRAVLSEDDKLKQIKLSRAVIVYIRGRAIYVSRASIRGEL